MDHSLNEVVGWSQYGVRCVDGPFGGSDSLVNGWLKCGSASAEYPPCCVADFGKRAECFGGLFEQGVCSQCGPKALRALAGVWTTTRFDVTGHQLSACTRNAVVMQREDGSAMGRLDEAEGPSGEVMNMNDIRLPMGVPIVPAMERTIPCVHPFVDATCLDPPVFNG